MFKALIDSDISQKGFKLVINDDQNYLFLKEIIRDLERSNKGLMKHGSSSATINLNSYAS